MIDSLEALRAIYPEPKERALMKQLSRLDAHCRRFVGLSPFVVVASGGAEGALDASPRGGAPGFVQVASEHSLLVPDSPGNNRLDTLTNIVTSGRVGLLFMIPGVDETLRVNGPARLVNDAEVLARFAGAERAPRLVIEVTVAEAYLHCAKALMRSRLWRAESQVERTALPTMGEMISAQTGAPLESQAQMLERYTRDL